MHVCPTDFPWTFFHERFTLLHAQRTKKKEGLLIVNKIFPYFFIQPVYQEQSQTTRDLASSAISRA